MKSFDAGTEPALPVRHDARGANDAKRHLKLDRRTAGCLALVAPLPAVERPISECLDRVLGTSVVAPVDVPPWPAATRDGYAIRAVDTAIAGPANAVRLRVVGQSAADALPGRSLPLGCAIEVMTGAPIPDGADAVVPAECCHAKARVATVETVDHYRSDADRWIEVAGKVEAGQFVVRSGAEFAAGAEALRAGVVLGPSELAVISALGYPYVRVVPRPRVAIIATGSELRSHAKGPATGKMHASNIALLQGMIAACGATTMSVTVARDDLADVSNALFTALSADLILTTGGTGRSARDLVRNALLDCEAHSLWNTPLRGSKPVALRLLREAGTQRLVPHLALPGRPIAATVAFILFAYPLLRHLSGFPAIAPAYVSARITMPIAGTAGHHRYIPTRLERRGKALHAVPQPESTLYGLAATAASHGFIVVGRRTGALSPGHRVRVLLPPWRGPNRIAPTP